MALSYIDACSREAKGFQDEINDALLSSPLYYYTRNGYKGWIKLYTIYTKKLVPRKELDGKRYVILQKLYFNISKLIEITSGCVTSLKKINVISSLKDDFQNSKLFDADNRYMQEINEIVDGYTNLNTELNALKTMCDNKNSVCNDVIELLGKLVRTVAENYDILNTAKNSQETTYREDEIYYATDKYYLYPRANIKSDSKISLEVWWEACPYKF